MNFGKTRRLMWRELSVIDRSVFGVVALAVVVGLAALAFSRAGTVVGFEPETGTLSSGVARIANLNASGGSSIMFAAAGTNLLVGRTFTATVADSAAESGPISNLTDGNETTRWISEAQSPVSAAIDLGGTAVIGRLRIVWAADTIKNYTVGVSADGSNWTTVLTGTTNNTSKQAVDSSSFDAMPKGRYLRITGTDRWNAAFGNSIWEVAAYGSISGPVVTPTPTPPTPTPTPPPSGSGIISLTFDDGQMGQYQNARPYLLSHHLPATFYLISDAFGYGGESMSGAQAAQLKADGFELGNHTQNHPDLTGLSASGISGQFSTAQNVISSQSGYTPVTCAYPYGAYSGAVDGVVRQLFRGCRGTNAQVNNPANMNVYNLGSYLMGSNYDAATIASWAAQARANNSWIILTYHGVGTGDASNGYDTPSVADFNAEMAAVANSGVRVMTVRDALTALGR